MDRRSFLRAALGGMIAPASTGAPETLSEWLKISPKERQLALKACLDRIRTQDASIHAWVQVQPQRPTGEGKLSEIPFGAKDIIETRGLATEYGSPIYKGRIGTADAAIVADLRRRGAVLVGKTHTTAFAYRTPAPTRNPRKLDHTPGGSSSGSAAAVAAGMIPFALGTQTGGSVLRPASYCGVTGFKPTYNLLSLEGVLPLAPSLDTLGFFTHTAADTLLLWDAVGRPTGAPETVPFAAPDPMPKVEPAMAAAFQAAVKQLRAAGLSIKSVDIASMLDKLSAANTTIMFYEGARIHQQRFTQYGSRLDDIADLVRQGLKISAQQFDEARRYVAACRRTLQEIYKATPVILVPAATGPAPAGLASTGDAQMNRPWTTLGTPAISIPMPVGDALPLGLQLTADRGQDARVIRTAIRVEEILRN